MSFLDGEWFARLLGVLGVNLILSGDNAVVITLAARRLGGSNRNKAIIWGAAGAVELRLVFAAVVSYLLSIPFLQGAGGLLLFWISWKLVQDPNEESKVRAGESTWEAIGIIILADAVMSLDNVIALVGVSDDNFLLLTIGIVTTIPLVIYGSTLLTSLLDRFPVLVYAGAGLLAYVAVEMFFEDIALHGYLEPLASIEWLVGLGTAAVFLAVAWLWARRTRETDRGRPRKP